jgi:C4-dicarboxylate-specific signal transduction histidine kinase
MSPDTRRCVGAVAHDLNNLLTTIRANAFFLMPGCNRCGAPAQELLEIDEAVDRACALTSALHALSRSPATAPAGAL